MKSVELAKNGSSVTAVSRVTGVTVNARTVGVPVKRGLVVNAGFLEIHQLLRVPCVLCVESSQLIL
jgi:hypothetical protein